MRGPVAAVMAAGICSGYAGSAAAAVQLELPVESVEVSGCKRWRAADVLALVPELSKKSVNIKTLSKQIQIVNDGGVLNLNSDFQKTDSDAYHVVLTVEEKRSEGVVESLSNTGNRYTGDWRLTTSYMNANLTNHMDSFGMAYVTSPGHWEDVKQVAAAYRMPLPKAAGSVYFTYSYSDVDMGTIANFGGLSMDATGKGHTYGVHYQQNLGYTSAHRQILDFGVDRKNYANQQTYSYGNRNLLEDGLDFTVTTLSLTYMESLRMKGQALSYSLGYVTNVGGDSKVYTASRYGSATTFHVWQAGLNYQCRLPANWIGSFRLNGQYTRDNLLSTEQFGAGGMYSVRGFSERAISADNGYAGGVELYSPEIAKGQRVVLFTDFARLFNNRANAGEVNSENIASAGIGYRFANEKSGLAVSVDYAKVIDDIEGAKNQDGRKWHVTVNMRF